MSGVIVLRQMLLERWRSLLAWTVSIAALMLVMLVFYPSIRDSGADFDAWIQSLPESARQTFGLADASMTTPIGYLVSQVYSNIYPLVVIIMTFSLAGWAIAGCEADGTLETTLSAPLRRWVLGLARFVGIALAALAVIAVSTGVLALSSPIFDLDVGLPGWGVWAAGLTMWGLVMVYTAVVFAVGAATGHRTWALAAGSALAVIGFLGQVFASLAEPLEFLQTISPWYWFLGNDPLTQAPGWTSLALPVALTVAVAAIGIAVFERRDLAV